MTERMQSLFAAAKQDGPTSKQRDAMWTGVEMASLGLAPPSAAALGVKGSAVLGSKLAIGIALGATITVGVAATLLMVANQTAPVPTHVTIAAPRALEHTTAQARDEGAITPVVITGHVAPTVFFGEMDAVAPKSKADIASDAHTGTISVAPAILSEQDRLAREARMVSEARGALHRGEPEVALRIVRAARFQTGARMVPEELTVEAQALRASGDEAGAKRIEAELAGKFPEQSPR